jgi:hypothetical protein
MSFKTGSAIMPVDYFAQLVFHSGQQLPVYIITEDLEETVGSLGTTCTAELNSEGVTPVVGPWALVIKHSHPCGRNTSHVRYCTLEELPKGHHTRASAALPRYTFRTED